MSLRIGTSGWSYPTGKGTWNGVFYPATRSKRDGTKDFDELRFYAEHFDTVEVNTTFYGHAARRGGAAVGRADAGRVRVLPEAVSEVHAPEDVPRGGAQSGARLGGAAPRPAGAGDAERRRRLPRGHRAAGGERAAGRAAGAVSAQLQGHARVARLSGAAAARVSRLPGGRRAPAQELERRVRRHAGAAERVRRRVRPDRRTEVQAVDPAELSAQRHELLLHAPARPERRAVVDAREERGPLQLPVLRAASCRSSPTWPEPRGGW